MSIRADEIVSAVCDRFGVTQEQALDMDFLMTHIHIHDVLFHLVIEHWDTDSFKGERRDMRRLLATLSFTGIYIQNAGFDHLPEEALLHEIYPDPDRFEQMRRLLRRDGIHWVAFHARKRLYDKKYPLDPSVEEDVQAILEKIQSGAYPVGDFEIIRGVAMVYHGGEDVVIPGDLILGESLFERSDQIQTVVVEPGQTALPERVFGWCKQLRAVTLPEGLEEIGERAFFNCEKLKTIQLPQGLKRIGASAFEQSGLTEIDLPDTVRKIGESAFSSTRIRSLTIPDSVEELGRSAFAWCLELTDVSYPAELKLPGRCFAVTPWLEAYLEKHPYLASHGTLLVANRKLTALTLPPEITRIDESALIGCDTQELTVQAESIEIQGVRYTWKKD